MKYDFEYLCSSLSKSCILTIALPDDDFLLQTDASGIGISGILSVCRNSAKLLPVAFFFRQLQERERKYAATELEYLAVKESIRQFEVYLHGRQFVVQTNHKALESLLKSTQLNSKLAGWALYLPQFSMEIKYRPGVINQNADSFSRQEWEDSDEGHIGKSEDGGEKDKEEKDNHVKTGEMSGNVP